MQPILIHPTFSCLCRFTTHPAMSSQTAFVSVRQQTPNLQPPLLPLPVPVQVHVPPCLPTDAELALVHCPDYLAAFSSCTLDEQRVRR